MENKTFPLLDIYLLSDLFIVLLEDCFEKLLDGHFLLFCFKFGLNINTIVIEEFLFSFSELDVEVWVGVEFFCEWDLEYVYEVVNDSFIFIVFDYVLLYLEEIISKSLRKLHQLMNVLLVMQIIIAIISKELFLQLHHNWENIAT